MARLEPRADDRTGSISIQALRSGAATPESAERNAAWVAAALLNYCFRRRIPIPRQGNKRIELVTEAIELVISTTQQVLPIELQAGALARGVAPEGAQVNAAPERAPAPQPSEATAESTLATTR